MDLKITLDAIVGIIALVLTIFISWPEIKSRFSRPANLGTKKQIHSISINKTFLAWVLLSFTAVYAIIRILSLAPVTSEFPSSTPVFSLPTSNAEAENTSQNSGKEVGLLFLIDVSASNQESDPNLKILSDLNTFLKGVNENDRINGIAFTHEVSPYSLSLVPANSMNKAALLQFFSDSRQVGGSGTALYDAICYAIETSNRAEQSTEKRKQVIILMTDGQDTSSTKTQMDALLCIANSKLPLNLIPIILGNYADVDFLNRLASATGTEVYTIDSDWIDEVFKKYIQ